MNDEELVDEAKRIIKQRYVKGRHHIGAALKTKSGRVFSGVHLEAYVGRIAICGEAVALGVAASTAGDTEIDTIVSVNAEGEIVSPCGMCREMITDYSPCAFVLIPDSSSEKGFSKVPAMELLPAKYCGNLQEYKNKMQKA